ncbi:hypothetical protein Barb6XT_02160 [Bacteroidales bacterium Barb6XT]|nr:hypothetical protein Barb6XT_02160 [Bacteroidales bacterium Barb6XT]
MATYQIHVDERTQLGKSIVALLKSSPDAVSFSEMPKEKVVAKKSRMYKRMEGGLKDVREIFDGKQPETTLKEFLDEL